MSYNGSVVYLNPISTENNSSSAAYSLGSRRVENGIEYVYVKNNGSSDIRPYQGTAPSGTYGVKLNDLTEGNIAGITTSVIEDGNYGWIAVKGGPLLASGVDSAATLAGEALICNEEGNFRTPLSTSAVSGIICGTAIDASNTVTPFNIYVNGCY